MAFGEKSERIAELEAEKASLVADYLGVREQLEAANRDIERLRHANEMVPELETRLRDVAEHIPQIAMSRVKDEVVEETREAMVKGLSQTLRAERGAEFAAEYRTSQAPVVKQQLHELFEDDGTYDAVREDVEDKVHAEIQNELLAEHRAAIVAELGSASVREAFTANVKAELEASSETAVMREQMRTSLEAAWTDEAQAEVHAQIEAEEAAKEADFKARYTASYLESHDARSLRAYYQNQFQATWSKKTTAEIAEEIKDKELTQLLQTRAQQEREALERQTQATELVSKFENGGIDTTKLGKDRKLVVYLGTIDAPMVQEYSYGRGYVNEQQKTLHCKRELTLCTLGDGRFIVDGDSLLEDTSEYARTLSLRRGTIITIGRKIKEDGVEKLDAKLAADVPLYFDANSLDAEFTDGIFPVANVSLDGVSAREFHTVVKD